MGAGRSGQSVARSVDRASGPAGSGIGCAWTTGSGTGVSGGGGAVLSVALSTGACATNCLERGFSTGLGAGGGGRSGSAAFSGAGGAMKLTNKVVASSGEGISR